MLKGLISFAAQINNSKQISSDYFTPNYNLDKAISQSHFNVVSEFNESSMLGWRFRRHDLLSQDNFVMTQQNWMGVA